MHVAVKNVFLDGVVEEGGFLLHESHPLAQLSEVVFSNIYPVNEHLAEVGVVKAHNQADKS